MASKPCIMSDRLYVHEDDVTEEHLLPFTYRIDPDDPQDRAAFNLPEGVTVIRTYNKVRLGDAGVYFGFSRGNIPLLRSMFGHIKWENHTACPPMNAELEFTKTLFTYPEKGIGQQEAADQWLTKKGGIVKAAPRFGKTVLAQYIICKLRVKTVIITHQIDLLRQFYETFQEFTNFMDIVEPDHVPGPSMFKRKKRDATGRVVGYFHDYDNPEELDVCLICWQTLSSKKNGLERLNKHFNTWGFLVIDEVHKMGGVAYAKTINQMNTRYRMGLTGTVERVDGRQFLLHNIMGPVTAVGLAEAVPCEVQVTYTGVEVAFGKQDPWPRLGQRLYKTVFRTELILDYVKRDAELGRFICIAFHSGSTAQLMHFSEMVSELGFSVGTFHGDLDPTPRKEALEKAKTGEIQILICNINMLTGINIPRWNIFYNMFPGGNVVINEEGEVSGNYRQQYSRVQTPFVYENGEKKTLGIIRDFVDDTQICLSLFKKRLKAYRTEKFEIRVVQNLSQKIGKKKNDK